jgi:hypothetical protein
MLEVCSRVFIRQPGPGSTPDAYRFSGRVCRIVNQFSRVEAPAAGGPQRLVWSYALDLLWGSGEERARMAGLEWDECQLERSLSALPETCPQLTAARCVLYEQLYGHSSDGVMISNLWQNNAWEFWYGTENLIRILYDRAVIYPRRAQGQRAQQTLKAVLALFGLTLKFRPGVWLLYSREHKYLLATGSMTEDRITVRPGAEPVELAGLTLPASLYRGEECIPCGLCGAEVRIRDTVPDMAGNLVCRVCSEQDYVTCAHCGERVRRSAARLHGRGWWCCGCYEQEYDVCHRCGETVPRERLVWWEGAYYCPSCLDDISALCDGCGSRFWRRSLAAGDDGGDERFCRSCRRGSIQGCGYVPGMLYYSRGGSRQRAGDLLYLGMEQEIYCERKYSLAQALHGLDPQEQEFCLKEDGSLRHGFEVVTQPRTFASWKQFVAEGTFGRVLAVEKEYQAVGHNEGGIHIHSSLAAWSGKQLYLLFVFIFNPAHRRRLTVLSQRHLCSRSFGDNACDGCGYTHCCLSHYASLEAVDAGSAKTSLERKSGDFQRTRYSALNITPHTVEFRLFNSNIRPDRVLKNIEVVQSLYEYIAETDEQTGVRWKDWVQFVQDRADRFSYLTAFLEEKCLIRGAGDMAADLSDDELREAI